MAADHIHQQKSNMKTTWHTTGSKAFAAKFGITQPIVLAPMAGTSTPSLTAAVCNEGGLGMYGAASTPPDQLPGVISEVKSLLHRTDSPFGINLFVPPASITPLTEQQQQALEAVHAYYAAAAVQHSLDCKPETIAMKPIPSLADLQTNFEAQVEAVLAAQVPVLSFYFGLPEQQLLSRIQAAGVLTMGTATCLDEAQQLEAAGIDCIVIQGSEAGGHRGTWYSTGDYRPHMVGTTTLTALIAKHTHIPLLAAGGIMTGQQVVAALAAGAAGVQLGTAFLTSTEAATPAAGKKLLLQDHSRGTTVTQAFTSRPARGLASNATRDLQHIQQQLPLGLIGLVNARPFFAAAAAAGATDVMMQLCGQGYPLCKESSARQIMQQLLAEADTAVRQFAEES